MGVFRRAAGRRKAHLAAARLHRFEQLLAALGAEEEHHAPRRLFKQLQKGVLRGKVHLVRFRENIDLAVGLVGQHERVHGERADLIDENFAPRLAGLVRGALDERHIRVDAGKLALKDLAAMPAGAAGLCAAALAERRRRHFTRPDARRGGVAGDYIGVHHLFHIDSVYHTHFWFDKRLRIEYYGKKQHGEGEI